VPGALYEVGVAVVVAMSFSPQLVEGVSRVRAARRLRGRAHRGLRGLRGVAMPVLEGALERSVDLAAAMDARGFGRGATSAGRLGRHASGALTLAGLLGVCAGLYGLLDAGSPVALGLPPLAAGAALAAVGLTLGGRRATRSRYRPDGWGAREWSVAASGFAAAGAALVGAATSPLSMHPSTSPLVVPGLALVPVLGLLAALLPARVAPAPEDEEQGDPKAASAERAARPTAGVAA